MATLLLFLTTANFGYTNCFHTSPQNQNNNCLNSSTFTVYCSPQSCSKSTINCADDYETNVVITGNKTCFKSTINITNLNTNNREKRLESNILCPTNAHCSIQCNDHICYSAKINAEYSCSLHVECGSNIRACNDLSIWCPINGSCNVHGHPHSSNITAMNIYSLNGFDTVNIDGITSSQSIGTMHCSHGYTEKCIISDNHKQCVTTNPLCDNSEGIQTRMRNNVFITKKTNQYWCPIDIQYIILSAIMMIFTTYITYKFMTVQAVKQEDKKDKALKWMAITISVSLWFSYFFWIIQICIGSYCADPRENDNARAYHMTKTSYLVIDIINNIFFGLSSVAFYAYLFYRLCFTFNYSTVRVKTNCKRFHKFVILLIPAWYGVLYYADVHMTVYFVSVICGLIMIFCGFLSLIILFNTKLRESLMSKKTILESTRKIPMYTSMTVRRKEEDLSQSVITKHTILSTIMLSIGMIFIFIVCILNFKALQRKSESWVTYEWFQGVSMLFNLLCVYLSFDCNDAQYRKMCGLCHGRVLNMHRRLIDKTQGGKSFLQSSMTSIDTYDAT